MMKKLNCWEVMECYREIGGSKAEELGVCPAASDTKSNGTNGGVNGGRFCWRIVGTFCGGKRQGTYAEKHASCLVCEFAQLVFKEEGIATKIM